MGGPQFTTAQNKALRETWDTEHNPTTAQEIFIAHDAGLSKKQVCGWFGRKRNQARARGEVEVGRGAVKDSSVSARMWFAYRFDPEGFVGKLRGEIDGETGKEVVGGGGGGVEGDEKGGEDEDAEKKGKGRGVEEGGDVDDGGKTEKDDSGEEADDENEPVDEKEDDDEEEVISKPPTTQKRKRNEADKKQPENKRRKVDDLETSK